MWKLLKSLISTDIRNLRPKKLEVFISLNNVCKEATWLKIGSVNRKFNFLTKLNITLVCLLLHESTPMTTGPSGTIVDSFAQKWLKTVHISRYFIWGGKSPIFQIFHLPSDKPILIIFSGNMEIKISLLDLGIKFIHR